MDFLAKGYDAQLSTKDNTSTEVAITLKISIYVCVCVCICESINKICS